MTLASVSHILYNSSYPAVEYNQTGAETRSLIIDAYAGREVSAQVRFARKVLVS